MKISIGIDIGSDGAYAVFIGSKLVYGKVPNTEGELDMRALWEIVSDAVPDDVDSIHCVIEDLHSVFGASAKSNFQFGVNNGLVIGTLQVSEIPFTKVAPKKWQKEMWEGVRPVEVPVMKKEKGKPAYHEKGKDGNPKYKIDTKATSLIAAKRLFPTESFLATERSSVPHDGIVDAVLMAEYCRRNY